MLGDIYICMYVIIVYIYLAHCISAQVALLVLYLYIYLMLLDSWEKYESSWYQSVLGNNPSRSF